MAVYKPHIKENPIAFPMTYSTGTLSCTACGWNGFFVRGSNYLDRSSKELHFRVCVFSSLFDAQQKRDIQYPHAGKFTYVPSSVLHNARVAMGVIRLNMDFYVLLNMMLLWFISFSFITSSPGPLPPRREAGYTLFTHARVNIPSFLGIRKKAHTYRTLIPYKNRACSFHANKGESSCSYGLFAAC